MFNTNTPTREAITLGATGSAVVELDPADLPVDADGMADTFADITINFLTAGWDLARLDNESFSVVWSDDLCPVRAVCPACDDVFDVADGVAIILDDEPALVCSDCESSDDDA